jgi:hypothetical protein
MIRTIHFADHGQDFLEWDIDAEGNVIDSRPLQAWIWVGAKVAIDFLEVNEFPIFKSKNGTVGTLKYKVIAIEEKEETHV